MTTLDRPERVDPTTMTPAEVEMARNARQCVMKALDHSKAPKIALTSEGETPSIELPPQVLKVIGQILGLMSAQQPFSVVPANHELSTVEAANFLNVSRPFVIKEMEEKRLPFHLVGTHRRVRFDDLERYAAQMRRNREAALDRMAANARELGLDY